MKEVKSKKTGKISILSDEEYRRLIDLKIDNRFTVEDITPIRSVLRPEPVKIKKVKNESGGAKDSE